jgi:hypothetical protein
MESTERDNEAHPKKGQPFAAGPTTSDTVGEKVPVVETLRKGPGHYGALTLSTA